MDKKPEHIAIIPDGNRRWASREGKSIIEGHQQGFQTFIDLWGWIKKTEIETLTAYGFSTENWKRSEDEVEGLMELFNQGLKDKVIEGGEGEFKNAKIRVVGDKEELSEELQKTATKVEDLTKENEKLRLNLAINYGGRWDIKQAIEKIVKQASKDEQTIEELLKKNLRVRSNPDLIIRTGGEKRLSNFLTWQSAYSELFFLDKLWPDFSKEDFKEVLKEYSKRKRRFGK
ncbi:MAG: polyprenyl diphosphate synthase [Candidatus Paceibacterota bacterium]